jgi:DNA invertase Pin-like site-specific DNA recombinase
MAMRGTFIAYYRVSTDRQGKSGLGLDGQRVAVENLLNGGSWKLLGEYVEIESGKRSDRPQLAIALEHCRMTSATLIVAKLDRLARNAKFLLTVVEGSGDGGVMFCDLPQLPAGPVGKFMLTQMAAVAELEAGLISQRTKTALAQSKKRLGGWRGGPKVDGKLGTAALQRRADDFAASVGPTVSKLRQTGASLRQIADELTARGIQTRRGGPWTPAGVLAVLKRSV